MRVGPTRPLANEPAPLMGWLGAPGKLNPQEPTHMIIQDVI